MWDCQHGSQRANGSHIGGVCRRKDLCRQEGRCYFVAGVERYLEAHNGQMPTSKLAPKRYAGPQITWHPGYDGYAWAI